MEPTVEKLISMMVYLGRHHYVIPCYNLPLPFEADGDNYRPNKMFRLLTNGTMEYQGWGLATSRMNPSPGKNDVCVSGISLSSRWVSRAYLFLSDEVREKVKAKTANAKMKDVGNLLLRFNKLEFIDLT